MTQRLPSPLEERLKELRFRRQVRVFPVSSPVTLYVRGSQCRVAINFHEYDHVEIYASLYAAFGMRLIVEQDEAGVYVIVKRRRILGLFSRSEVNLNVPHYCNLAFDLTPGAVEFQHINGTLEIPGHDITAERKAIIMGTEHESLPEPQEPTPQLTTGKQQ